MTRCSSLFLKVLLFFATISFLFNCEEKREYENIVGGDACNYDFSNFVTSKHSELGFQISFPEDYTIIDNKSLTFAALKKKANPEHLESFAIQTQYNTLNLRLEEFFKESTAIEFEELKKSNEVKDFEVLEEGNSIINGESVTWIIYSYVENNFPTTLLSCFLLNEGVLYHITFASNRDSFDSYACTYSAILNSLKFN